MTTGLFRNLGLKMLAVALGIIVWYLVAGEQIVERGLRIPLEFVNLPAQLELVGDSPTVVDVRVRGSSGALSRIGTPGTGRNSAVLPVRLRWYSAGLCMWPQKVTKQVVACRLSAAASRLST